MYKYFSFLPKQLHVSRLWATIPPKPILRWPIFFQNFTEICSIFLQHSPNSWWKVAAFQIAMKIASLYVTVLHSLSVHNTCRHETSSKWISYIPLISKNHILSSKNLALQFVRGFYHPYRCIGSRIIPWIFHEMNIRCWRIF